MKIFPPHHAQRRQLGDRLAEAGARHDGDDVVAVLVGEHTTDEGIGHAVLGLVRSDDRFPSLVQGRCSEPFVPDRGMINFFDDSFEDFLRYFP